MATIVKYSDTDFEIFLRGYSQALRWSLRSAVKFCHDSGFKYKIDCAA